MMWRRIQWQGQNCNKLQYIRIQVAMSFPASWCIRVVTTARLHASATCQISTFTFPPLEASGAWWPSNEFGPRGLVWGVCAMLVYSKWKMDWWWLMQREIEPTSIQAASDRVTRFAGGLGPVCEQNCGLGPSLHSLHLRYMFGIVWAHYCDRSKWRQWPYPNGGL